MRARKPASWLNYPTGTVGEMIDQGFTSVTIYCVGPPEGERCLHQRRVELKDLPDLPWSEIGPRLACHNCDTVGYVSISPNWHEVTEFKPLTG